MGESWDPQKDDLVFPDELFSVENPFESDCGLLSWNPQGLFDSAGPFLSLQGSHLSAATGAPLALGPEAGGAQMALSRALISAGPSALNHQGPIGGSGRHAPRRLEGILPQVAASAPSSYNSQSLACASAASTPTSSGSSQKESGAEMSMEVQQLRRGTRAMSVSKVSSGSQQGGRSQAATSQQAGSHAPGGSSRETVVSLHDFVWINEDHVVRVLVPVPGVERLTPGSIKSSFTRNSLELEILGLPGGVVYRLAVDSLYGEVQPGQCWHEVLPGKVIINLKKVAEGPSDGPDTNIFTWFSLRL